MKRTTIIISTCLFSLGLFFSACERDIEIDIPNQQKLVVLSNFSPDTTFRLHLSVSKLINQNIDDRSRFPDNASIQLYEDGNYVDDFLFQESNDPSFFSPYYYLNERPKKGVEYSVVAHVPGYPETKAKSSIPEAATIDQLELFSSAFLESKDDPSLLDYTLESRLKVSTTTNAPAYYHIKASRNPVFYYLQGSDTVRYSFDDFTSSVDLTLSNEIQHLKILHEEGILIDQQAFIDNPDGIPLKLSYFFDRRDEIKAPIDLEIRRVSPDYYLFHKSVGEQEFSEVRESLFSTQSALIYNNIENGIGNFSGFATTFGALDWQ